MKRPRIHLVLEPTPTCCRLTTALKWLLKRLLREYGLRCVDYWIEPEVEPEPETPDATSTEPEVR